MKNRLLLLLIGTTVIFSSCIDTYDFTVNDNDEGIVVEAYISNISYEESLEYPSEGRYFVAILHKTSTVSNVTDEYISDALVQLTDSANNTWKYTESESDPGYYYIKNDTFKATYQTKYQLQITLPDDTTTITSEWCQMPVNHTDLNEVSMEETVVEQYHNSQNYSYIESVEGVNVYISTPENASGQTMRYKWNYEPIWTFIAPYASNSFAGYKCWITSSNYLSGYSLYEGTKGNINNKLFFIETTDNERLYRYFSVLIHQQVMNEGYYNFYKDMKTQSERGGLFEEPPFSLTTNYESNDPELKISGYFDVVTENAFRWEFDKSELSYDLVNDLRERCDEPSTHTPPGTPPKSCDDCREYTYGDAVNYAPNWWYQ